MPHSTARLVLVTRQDKHRFFHDFLMSATGMDGVHRISDRNELLANRIGSNQYSTKRTFILVDGPEWDPRVLSAIYTRSGTHDFTKIKDVLEEPATEMSVDPTHYQFYSVTNVLDKDNKPLVRGAAKILIGMLKGFLEEETGFETHKKTFSPFRTFKAFLAKNNITVDVFRDLSQKTQITLVMDHFCERHPKNLAQRAHMPNGAVLRNIYMDAASPEKPDGACMVAYDYTHTSEQLSANAIHYKEGRYPVDPSLEPYVPHNQSGILVPAYV